MHADDGLDELSTLGKTRISELAEGEVRTWRLDPKDLGIPYARLSDLQVNSARESADIIEDILRGKKGAARDIAVLNAAGALVVAGASPDLAAALFQAQTAVDDGSAKRALESLARLSQ